MAPCISVEGKENSINITGDIIITRERNLILLNQGPVEAVKHHLKGQQKYTLTTDINGRILEANDSGKLEETSSVTQLIGPAPKVIYIK